jgi:hypothetical protein
LEDVSALFSHLETTERSGMMTQQQWVLRQLNKQGLTPAQAFTRFGIMRLAAIVHRLKRKGHRINTSIERRNGKEFARYTKG